MHPITREGVARALKYRDTSACDNPTGESDIGLSGAKQAKHLPITERSVNDIGLSDAFLGFEGDDIGLSDANRARFIRCIGESVYRVQ